MDDIFHLGFHYWEHLCISIPWLQLSMNRFGEINFRKMLVPITKVWSYCFPDWIHTRPSTYEQLWQLERPPALSVGITPLSQKEHKDVICCVWEKYEKLYIPDAACTFALHQNNQYTPAAYIYIYLWLCSAFCVFLMSFTTASCERSCFPSSHTLSETLHKTLLNQDPNSKHRSKGIKVIFQNLAINGNIFHFKRTYMIIHRQSHICSEFT